MEKISISRFEDVVSLQEGNEGMNLLELKKVVGKLTKKKIAELNDDLDNSIVSEYTIGFLRSSSGLSLKKGDMLSYINALTLGGNYIEWNADADLVYAGESVFLDTENNVDIYIKKKGKKKILGKVVSGFVDKKERKIVTQDKNAVKKEPKIEEKNDVINDKDKDKDKNKDKDDATEEKVVSSENIDDMTEDKGVKIKNIGDVIEEPKKEPKSEEIIVLGKIPAVKIESGPVYSDTRALVLEVVNPWLNRGYVEAESLFHRPIQKELVEKLNIIKELSARIKMTGITLERLNSLFEKIIEIEEFDTLDIFDVNDMKKIYLEIRNFYQYEGSFCGNVKGSIDYSKRYRKVEDEIFDIMKGNWWNPFDDTGNTGGKQNWIQDWVNSSEKLGEQEYTLAQDFLKNKQYRKALVHLRKALKVNPSLKSNPKFQLHIGFAYLREGLKGKIGKHTDYPDYFLHAEFHFKEALNLRPSNTNIYRYLHTVCDLLAKIQENKENEKKGSVIDYRKRANRYKLIFNTIVKHLETKKEQEGEGAKNKESHELGNFGEYLWKDLQSTYSNIIEVGGDMVKRASFNKEERKMFDYIERDNFTLLKNAVLRLM